MISPVEIETWDEAVQYIKTSYVGEMNLTWIIDYEGVERSKAPYVNDFREIIDLIINFWEHQNTDTTLLHIRYELIFGIAVEALWSFYGPHSDVPAPTYQNQAEIERAIVDLLVSKHHDYGPGNIWRFKHTGLMVRMNDKVARLENLIGSGRLPANESLHDSFIDLAGYSIVGGMLINDTFLLPLKNTEKRDKNEQK